MATLRLVETSLRDGNQSLWAALGVDTARTLSIAPALDRAGYKALDFTTSTHMGVAPCATSRKDPLGAHIRLTARRLHAQHPAAAVSSPPASASIAWGDRQPRLHGPGLQGPLVKNGMRRFALADPMNDIPGNLAGALPFMAKAGGADYVVGALVYTVSPDPRRRPLRHRPAPGRWPPAPTSTPSTSRTPASLLTATRARTLIPAVMAEIGGQAALELHAHCTIGLADQAHYLDGAELRDRDLCGVRLEAQRRTARPTRRWNASSCQPHEALGHSASTSTRRRWPQAPASCCPALAEAEEPAPAPASPRPSTPPTTATSCPAAWSAPCAATSASSACRTWRAKVIEEIGRVREGARLADRDDPPSPRW